MITEFLTEVLQRRFEAPASVGSDVSLGVEERVFDERRLELVSVRVRIRGVKGRVRTHHEHEKIVVQRLLRRLRRIASNIREHGLPRKSYP